MVVEASSNRAQYHGQLVNGARVEDRHLVVIIGLNEISFEGWSWVTRNDSALITAVQGADEQNMTTYVRFGPRQSQ